VNKQETLKELEELGCNVEEAEGGAVIDRFYLTDTLLANFLELIRINDRIDNS
jgi:hypothetical protein